MSFAIGDWVQGSDSPEFDMTARGAVGYYIRTRRTGSYPVDYLIGPEIEGKIWGAYKHIRKVTKAEGREIVKGWREARQERWYSQTPKGEQIRAFLREEARRRRATCDPTLICPEPAETDCSDEPPENMLAPL